MDPAESQHMSLNTPRNNNMLSDTSPRRRIDTNRTITPGGTTITTTTTTTERRNPSPRESAYGSIYPIKHIKFLVFLCVNGLVTYLNEKLKKYWLSFA